MNLYLLRHGDTGKRISGVNDPAITESAKNEVVTTVLTSPLRRTIQTARIVIKPLGIGEKVVSFAMN